MNTIKRVKINYTTPYANDTINGYVFAVEHSDHYEITQHQYNRAYDNLTIGGDVSPQFDNKNNKPVIVR